MIDMHVHVVEPNLPGAGSLGGVLALPLAERAAAVRAEMRAAGIGAALCMGSLGAPENDPLGIAETLELAKLVPGLFSIRAMDPRRNEPEHLLVIERALKSGIVKAINGYLGY